MIIDFESRRTTLVATPVDGRCGLSSLTQIAESILGIKVTEGADYVVFISKARKICRIIFWDELGGCVITRRLNSGRFARYLMRATGPAAASLSARELSDYLDGKELQVSRTGLLKKRLFWTFGEIGVPRATRPSPETKSALDPVSLE